MKKRVVLISAIVLGFVLLLSSCSSCSLIEKIKEQLQPTAATEPTAAEDPVSPEEEKIISLMSGELDLDSMSLSELKALAKLLDEEDNALSALRGGAESDLLYGDPEEVRFDANAELSFDYPESAQVAVVSDTPWVDKNWEALDITEGMTPEEKAAYEAAMGELENFNADEFQAGIDEMLQDQEGFEDYQPSSSPGDPKVSTEWPDSAIARQLPKPPFTRSMVVEEENSVMLTNNTATLQEVKAYVSEVKKAGFTESVNENEQNIAGYSIYTFTAENSAGYVVSIQFMAGTMTLSITR